MADDLTGTETIDAQNTDVMNLITSMGLDQFLASGGGNTVAPPDLGPLYGYGPEVTEYRGGMPTQADRNDPWYDPQRMMTGGTTRAPIYGAEIFENLRGLTAQQRQTLALEMFAFVPGAYRDIDEIMSPDGVLNDESYYYAVQQTLQMAEQFGPEGIGDNPIYLDILMGDNERSPEEFQAAFAARAATFAKSRGGGGGGGGGRVINYIDPVGLAAAAKNAFAQTTGRKATKEEQQAFVKQIHGLQSSGATGIDVGSRAEAFASSSAPAESGAMDYAGAASLVMQAIGL